MAPLEIRHRSVRPISAKHAQASRFLQQSPIGQCAEAARTAGSDQQCTITVKAPAAPAQ
ncbi:DUF6118 family protein [Enterobacter hormaechei]|uniref:DUF6118 family protein n=1 Tax=Klebsiella quasipneumoniae TaxID=1463165 RepID=UPI002FD4940F